MAAGKAGKRASPMCQAGKAGREVNHAKSRKESQVSYPSFLWGVESPLSSLAREEIKGMVNGSLPDQQLL